MKTLDEVIKAYEQCRGDKCYECPYHEKVHTNSCIAKRDTDALHYLKEYREQKELNEHIYAEYKRRAEMYSDWKNEQALAELPLSWDELKQMEGMPVWVEALLYKQWAVIAYVGEEHIRFEGVNLYAPESRIYMGKENGWQAYRKEWK